MKFPQCEEEWKQIALEFKQRWNFDTCVGAIDGKHINIVKPPNSGSIYYNYKGKFSIVLMAVVDAQYKFIMVQTGRNGRVSEGGVLYHTTFYDKLVNGTLNLPKPENVEGTQFTLPYVFVGDEAFPLLPNLMKPYPRKKLNPDERIFNYRQSRARRIVENAFGIMSSRFGVFKTDISLSVDKVDCIVLACCASYNFLRDESKHYIPPRYADEEDVEVGELRFGQWREERQLTPLQRMTRPTTVATTEARSQYKQYFNSVGSVPFAE
nr:protein ALP1-like [Onthophagus taurus]